MNVEKALIHYLATGIVNTDPHSIPGFVDLLKQTLTDWFQVLEPQYQERRKHLLQGSGFRDFSNEDFIDLTYQGVLATFPEISEVIEKDQVLDYAKKNLKLMSLDQLLRDMPNEEPPQEYESVHYDIFGNTTFKGTAVGLCDQFPLLWAEYGGWIARHLSTLSGDNSKLPRELRLNYGAKYESNGVDPAIPFKIVAFNAGIEAIGWSPSFGLGQEMCAFSHELVHFFQHYLIPTKYESIAGWRHSDIISSGISSLVTYSAGLPPGDDHLLALDTHDHYRVGALMGLRCSGAEEPFKQFRERLDRYIRGSSEMPHPFSINV